MPSEFEVGSPMGSPLATSTPPPEASWEDLTDWREVVGDAIPELAESGEEEPEPEPERGRTRERVNRQEQSRGRGRRNLTVSRFHSVCVDVYDLSFKQQQKKKKE